MAINLNVSLHPNQQTILERKARFKCVAAGRRFGKSRLAAWLLIIEGLKSNSKDVFYVAPTFQQAKDIMWDLLKDIGKDVIRAVHENTGVITLVNGRKIYLKGSDRPDTMRGVGLCYVVVDEYADMKPMVWEQILRPALADVKGGALFIGTPKGRNHFYEMYTAALQFEEDGEGEEWAAFHYTSFDNPLLDPAEIEAARASMSSFAFNQEFMASFEAAGSDVFKQEWLKFERQNPLKGPSESFMAVDLAGFEAVASQASNKKKRLDRSSICVAEVFDEGWWIPIIKYGRWDIKETARIILDTAQQYDVRTIGIEKGALRNAIMPYMQDTMMRMGFFPAFVELTHGNKKKTDRVVWALQGRFEHGRIFMQKAEWNKDFVDEYLNFPNPLVHDDLLDSLAYIDQLAISPFFSDHEDTEYEVLDVIAGY